MFENVITPPEEIRRRLIQGTVQKNSECRKWFVNSTLTVDLDTTEGIEDFPVDKVACWIWHEAKGDEVWHSCGNQWCIFPKHIKIKEDGYVYFDLHRPKVIEVIDVEFEVL